jgi:hypothetical protein
MVPGAACWRGSSGALLRGRDELQRAAKNFVGDNDDLALGPVCVSVV